MRPTGFMGTLVCNKDYVTFAAPGVQDGDSLPPQFANWCCNAGNVSAVDNWHFRVEDVVMWTGEQMVRWSGGQVVKGSGILNQFYQRHQFWYLPESVLSISVFSISVVKVASSVSTVSGSVGPSVSASVSALSSSRSYPAPRCLCHQGATNCLLQQLRLLRLSEFVEFY